MANKNGKVKEIWGRKFSLTKNGLDEQEVFSFVGNLIDQNNEYAKKLEHLDYLVKLGENTVIEADNEAERIKSQAHERAEEDAQILIDKIGDEARAQAERIIADAEEEAKVRAEDIILVTQSIVQERVSASEQLAQDMVKRAEAEAERKVREMKKQARKKARAIVKAANEHLLRCKELSESEIRAKFESVFREMLETLEPQSINPEETDES